MADQRIEVFSDTIVPLTINVKDAEGDAYVLTGKTCVLKVYALEEDTRASNRFTASCTIADGANGQLTVTLSKANTTLSDASHEDHFDGWWVVSIVDGSTEDDITIPQKFVIRRNMTVATT